MPTALCPIVGIGASAEGLEAIRALFQSMPGDTGAAFVVIQHPEAAQARLTAESLMQCTSMRTTPGLAGMLVEPNRVYIVPPHVSLRLKGHLLEVGKPLRRHGAQMPVDTFLTSLAEQHRERAVAVIVSGPSSDGTLGVRAAKGSGSLVLAQCPTPAPHDAMPRSVITTGLVDFVCPVEAMHEHITGYLRQVYVIQRVAITASAPATDADAQYMNQILALVASRTGHDFRGYKQGTVIRRIARRMVLRHIDRLSEYLTYLRADDDEIRHLLQDLVIGVTRFYRDSDAFEELEREVISPLIDRKQVDEPIRVWVPGCATGEEAYSVAMLLIERMNGAAKFCPIRVFATDIDEAALTIARRGLYPKSAAAGLAPDRLERFFVQEDHCYRVSKRLREIITFSGHNLIRDPPFSKLDLICCRNLLIYLNRREQRSALAIFHFALREEGCLFLGHSETTASDEILFTTVSKKSRIYRRNSARLLPISDVLGGLPVYRPALERPAVAAVKITSRELASTIEELTLANEASHAANEESISINEELQTANEELEASKEELQSVNEELSAVNAELKEKVDELADSNTDIANLLNSTDIATIFVDSELKIGRFTPSINRVMNLIESDIGRPLSDLRPKIQDRTLIDDVRRVLSTHTPQEAELSTSTGVCYLRRILPYRTKDDRVTGAVIAFIDLSARKLAEDALQDRENDLKETVAKLNAEIFERQRVENALLESTNEERRRLGRDLHDGLGQELSGLALLAAAATSSLRKAGRPEADAVNEIAHVANQAIANCRAIAHGMSPVALAGGSLVTALEEMVKLQRNSFGFNARCEVTQAAPLRLPQDEVESLYRIAQEAVTNARRHSKANLIVITLNIQLGNVRLEVIDNGIGLPPGSLAAQTGMGLKIMELRANLVAAQLKISPNHPTGTRVTVDCPQPREARVTKMPA